MSALSIWSCKNIIFFVCTYQKYPYLCHPNHAEIAQLVEHDLAKVGVASSSLVFRSQKVQQCCWTFFVRKSLPPVALRHPPRGICRNLLRRTRVAPWLVSSGHTAHSATALMRLAIPVTCFFCDLTPIRGRVRSSWSKPAIRICEVPALEGSVEGAGLECGRISPRIDSSPFVWIPVEGVLCECECRVWVRQLISWTQNDWEGYWNHSVARSYLPAALRVVSSWSGEACPPTDWSSGRGPTNASSA